jgi:hypothetical protein
MQLDVADGDAARERARRGYKEGWHPILSAVELEPGRWQMVAQYDVIYGEIRLARIHGEACYIAVDLYGREAAFKSLRSAAEGVQSVYVRSHGAPEFQGYPKVEYRSP